MKTTVHAVKCTPEHFDAVSAGRKTAELRLNDRDYQVHDVLQLNEFADDKLTGKAIRRRITHIVRDGPWLAPGYVMLSLGPVRPPEVDAMGYLGGAADAIANRIVIEAPKRPTLNSPAWVVIDKATADRDVDYPGEFIGEFLWFEAARRARLEEIGRQLFAYINKRRSNGD